MSKRILIVDDSKVARMMITAMFQEAMPDCQVDEAEDGLKALQMIQRQDYDIVTLDLNMPGMDGLDVAREIRRVTSVTRLFLITANIQESIKMRANEINVTFIKKPVSSEIIKEIIKS